ncbi:TM2 domain-containing protein [Solidesulfovibrio sp.]
MSLAIEPSIAARIPTSAKAALAKMTDEQQMMFVEEFKRRSKSTGLMVFLAIVFPIQLFLLGKVGLGFVFLLTMGGFWLWYIVEWFLTPGRVREYNADVATKIVMEIKVMGA